VPRLAGLFSASKFLSSYVISHPRLIEPLFEDPQRLLLDREALRAQLAALTRSEEGSERDPTDVRLNGLRLFHHSQLNAFNLADDLIEPYRPYVELWAFRLISDDGTAFSVAHKAHMLRVLQLTCQIDRKRHTMMYAMERTVKSLITASRTQKAHNLLLPVLDEMPHIKELT